MGKVGKVGKVRKETVAAQKTQSLRQAAALMVALKAKTLAVWVPYYRNKSPKCRRNQTPTEKVGIAPQLQPLWCTKYSKSKRPC
jgi:hypothetical protein